MMAVISTTSMAMSSLREIGQAALQRLAFQQAQRIAERAEAEAQRLRRQADALKAEAARKQEDARRLYRESDRQEEAANLARRGSVLARSQNAMGEDLLRRIERIVPAAEGRETAPQTNPVRNAEGQLTGQVIDTTA